MANNHGIYIVANGTQAPIKTSALRGFNQVVNSTQKGFKGYFDKFDKAVKNVPVSSGMSFNMGKTTAIIGQGVRLASGGIDILLNIHDARTGESIYVNNMRRLKKAVLDPIDFVVDSTYGNWIRNLRINRENTSNDRARELSGNVIVGHQYGHKR